jgi:hypothetical protein
MSHTHTYIHNAYTYTMPTLYVRVSDQRVEEVRGRYEVEPLVLLAGSHRAVHANPRPDPIQELQQLCVCVCVCVCEREREGGATMSK